MGKLTDTQREEIRRRLSSEGVRELARQYGVHPQVISRINKRRVREVDAQQPVEETGAPSPRGNPPPAPRHPEHLGAHISRRGASEPGSGLRGALASVSEGLGQRPGVMAFVLLMAGLGIALSLTMGKAGAAMVGAVALLSLVVARSPEWLEAGWGFTRRHWMKTLIPAGIAVLGYLATNVLGGFDWVDRLLHRHGPGASNEGGVGAKVEGPTPNPTPLGTVYGAGGTPIAGLTIETPQAPNTTPTQSALVPTETPNESRKEVVALHAQETAEEQRYQTWLVGLSRTQTPSPPRSLIAANLYPIVGWPTPTDTSKKFKGILRGLAGKDQLAYPTPTPKSLPMIACDVKAGELWLLSGSKLSAEREKELRAHMQGCLFCQARYEALSQRFAKERDEILKDRDAREDADPATMRRYVPGAVVVTAGEEGNPAVIGSEATIGVKLAGSKMDVSWEPSGFPNGARFRYLAVTGRRVTDAGHARFEFSPEATYPFAAPNLSDLSVFAVVYVVRVIDPGR